MTDPHYNTHHLIATIRCVGRRTLIKAASRLAHPALMPHLISATAPLWAPNQLCQDIGLDRAAPKTWRLSLAGALDKIHVLRLAIRLDRFWQCCRFMASYNYTTVRYHRTSKLYVIDWSDPHDACYPPHMGISLFVYLISSHIGLPTRFNICPMKSASYWL